MSIQWGFFFSFILSGSFFYNINPTTPLLNPPGAYLFLTHLIEEVGVGYLRKGPVLFNLLSVCLKELEHKVKKLNCKKWGGGGGGGELI